MSTTEILDGISCPMLHPRQLIAARALAGWSQAELAAAAKVALTTVQGLEGGGRDTKFSSVVAILEALRQQGVELAQGSDRYRGGVVVVRGSAADWLPNVASDSSTPEIEEVGERAQGHAASDAQYSAEPLGRRRADRRRSRNDVA